MATRWFGASIPRNEDPRLLRGKGSYVDDIDLPEQLHAAVLRCTHARARILTIDVGAARELPGVHLLRTASLLGEGIEPSTLLVLHGSLMKPPRELRLARNDVRHHREAL